MSHVSQNFSEIRAGFAVLNALIRGRNDNNSQFEDGVSDHDFLLKTEDRFAALMLEVATDLAERFAEAEDLGVMDVLSNAACAIQVPEVVVEVGP